MEMGRPRLGKGDFEVEVEAVVGPAKKHSSEIREERRGGLC